MRRLFLPFAALLLAPSAGGYGAWMVGTEDLPELPDTEGDVDVAPGYLGPTEFADLTAAWFEYDEATDRVMATIRVASGERLEEAPAGHKVGCSFRGNVTADGKVVGVLVYVWTQAQDQSSLDHQVRWTEPTSAASGSGLFLPHDFAAEPETPGYFRFWVERSNLTALGDQIENPSGACLVFVDPCQTDGISCFGGINRVSDDAASQASYSFRDLRQSRGPQGEALDPVEAFERGEQAPSAPSTSPPDRTPGLVVGLFALALAVAVGATRRRHKND